MKYILPILLVIFLPLQLFADSCDEVWTSASGPDLKALEECHKLAESGNAHNELSYGLWLFGRLPPEYQNKAEGIKWIRKSAEHGNQVARVGLAMFLSADDESLKDFRNYIEAYAWYAVLNDEKSMKRIAEKLTPEELKKAKTLAKKYIEKYGIEESASGLD
jgi:TPR repeat protein